MDRCNGAVFDVLTCVRSQMWQVARALGAQTNDERNNLRMAEGGPLAVKCNLPAIGLGMSRQSNSLLSIVVS